MVTKWKVLDKIIKIIVIVFVSFLCHQVTLQNFETHSSNKNLNKTIDLHAMAQKIAEIEYTDLYDPIDTYNGRLTGYAADCPLCGGRLACNGQNVLDRTITHYDSEYGSVRIVASSSNLPCGTIVQFSLAKFSVEPITAIVLDRGVLGTSLDLLVENEDYARSHIGSNNISYDVLRIGYTK